MQNLYDYWDGVLTAAANSRIPILPFSSLK
jgi:hypothetical protein